jgi:hypothetical protein
VKESLIYDNLASLLPCKMTSTLTDNNNQISNDLAFQHWNRHTGEDDGRYILEIDPANPDRCQIKEIGNTPA